MSLNLQKDLCVFDLETTGLDISKDRIVEISILKVTPSGEEIRYTRRVNPEMPISAESTNIHGITDEDVKEAPTFRELAPEIAEFIGDADIAGYNSNKFDVPLLVEEFLRVDFEFDMASRNFIDVQNIFHKMEQRTLVAAYKFYCDKNLEDAHNAQADVTATFEVFKAQLERYEDLENDMTFLAEFSKNNKNDIADFAGRLAKNSKGEICYNFGKHKGKTVEEVYNTESGYYGWMMDSDFPRYTKAILKAEVERIKAKHQKERENKKEQATKTMENKLEALKNKFSK